MVNELVILLLTWFGFQVNQPKHDLRRKSTSEDFRRRVNLWVLNNYGIVALTTIIILLIIFTIVCFMIVGVSATEDGIYQLDKVI